jgi:hypothetical protein
MNEILEQNARVMRLTHEWMGLAMQHSAAMRVAADDRNEIAGKVYETRKSLTASIEAMGDMVRRRAMPTEAEADIDTLQMCALHGLQVND